MNRKTFFRRIPVLSPGERHRVQWAYNIAKKWHCGQLRDSGLRHFEHVRNAAISLIKHGYADADYIIKALLHDGPEDTTVSVSMLERLFGTRNTREILALSKSYGVEDPVTGFVIRSRKRSDREYFGGISRFGKRAVLVKLVDRVDNLSDLVDEPPAGSRWTPQKRLAYVAETRKWILPLADRYEPRFAKKMRRLCARIEANIRASSKRVR
jgi:GTP diphosphokinase / guanosine-3',5'-bis(diphosphate) 3'-diphosphatase